MTVIRLTTRPRRIDEVCIAAVNPAEELHALQSIIDGYIECVRLTDDAAMLVDEEGVLKGLQRNEVASLIAHTHIVGTAVIVGIEHTDDGDIFTDCPAHIVRSLYA